jgi:cytochrome d ubiquinol oxidase subunit I
VASVFWSFRVMVGMGVLMLAAAWFGIFRLWRRGSLPRYMLWILSAMTFAGWVATLAGWYVTEIGRQPWIVYGMVKTADVVGPQPSVMVGSTLAGYLLLYALLLLAYVSVVKYLAENPELAAPPLPAAPPAGEPSTSKY